MGPQVVSLAPVSWSSQRHASLLVGSVIPMSLPLLCPLSVSSLGESSHTHPEPSQVLLWRFLSNEQSGVYPRGDLLPSESCYQGDQPLGVLLRLNLSPWALASVHHLTRAFISMAGTGRQSLLENMKEGRYRAGSPHRGEKPAGAKRELQCQSLSSWQEAATEKGGVTFFLSP